jgi:plastocyanin
MKKELLILVIVALLGALFIGYQYFFLNSTPALETKPVAEVPEGAVVVTLSKDGFSPDEISIQVGDTVAFRSTAGEPFWPASNLHPSHTIYPEFDPQKPIQPDAVWSFTFTKAGEWKYHDHLAPYFTGVITVTE